MDAECHIVEHVRWITDPIIKIRFYGISAKCLLSPRAPVAGGEWADEIRPNDATILLGQYVAVVQPGEEGQSSQNREAVTNWLKIIGVEQYSFASRRGTSRASNTHKVLPRWTFR